MGKVGARLVGVLARRLISLVGGGEFVGGATVSLLIEATRIGVEDEADQLTPSQAEANRMNRTNNVQRAKSIFFIVRKSFITSRMRLNS